MADTNDRTCEGCAFWKQVAGNVGQCRRRSPQPAMASLVPDNGPGTWRASWPDTLEDDWCGEFSPRVSAPTRAALGAALARVPEPEGG